jgi:hypothetical protein
MKNNNTFTSSEKPLNAKYYAFDQSLPLEVEKPINFFVTLSQFMADAIHVWFDEPTNEDNL